MTKKFNIEWKSPQNNTKFDIFGKSGERKVSLVMRRAMGNRQSESKLPKMKTLNKIKYFSYPKQVCSSKIWKDR